MLLADLADPGDRVSVITFGKDARVAASVQIQNDADRVSFKRQVRARVDFTENYSDIRKGIRRLAENQDTVFRGKDQSVRVVILLSDGKLEPADGKTPEAFQEIQADLKGALADVGVYAVALGDTTSRHVILRDDGREVNGQILMRDYIARSPDRFFHARSLDQLLDVAVLVLNKSKGISSLGEEGKSEVRVDDTVEAMTLIVRKRTTDGKTLLQSSDIAVHWPGGQPVTADNRGGLSGDALYWSEDYHYFDLLVVRKPVKGSWAVTLRTGETPQVLSKISTPIELRVSARDRYYLNEAASLTAGLFNRRTGAVSRGPYEIRAHVAADGALAASNLFIPLQPEGDSGQFALSMPGDLLAGLGQNRPRGPILVELIAQRREAPGSSSLDPWFIRRSAPLRVELIEPFIEWTTQPARLTRIPFRPSPLTFGAKERLPGNGAPAGTHPPRFDSPPRLTVSIQRLDQKAQAYRPHAQTTLEGAPEQSARVYRAQIPISETAAYRYAYRLEGTTRLGRFVIESPWYGFGVRFCWECVGTAAAALLALGGWHSGRSARLKGQVAARSAGGGVASVTIRPARSFSSTAIPPLNQPGVPRFTLVPRRLFYVLAKRVRLTVSGGEGALDGRRIPAGQAVAFRPAGKHKLRLTHPDGSVTEIEMTLRV